jgi:NAD(P)-dependent dehydrogenase (short-subunit alcohol dehydrogenase family)
MALFSRVIEINLIGTMRVMTQAAAGMAALAPLGPDDLRGVVVNTASVAAWEGQIGQAAYASSKGAVAALTLPAARDLARAGVRVLAIAPGLFGTPMVRGLPQEAQDSLAAQVT